MPKPNYETGTIQAGEFDPHKIHYAILKPKNFNPERKYPIVLGMHGYASNYEQTVTPLMNQIHERGYPVVGVTYDKRFHGKSFVEGEGYLHKFDVNSYKFDLDAIMKKAASLEFTDENDVRVFSSSLSWRELFYYVVEKKRYQERGNGKPDRRQEYPRITHILLASPIVNPRETINGNNSGGKAKKSLKRGLVSAGYNIAKNYPDSWGRLLKALPFFDEKHNELYITDPRGVIIPAKALKKIEEIEDMVTYIRQNELYFDDIKIGAIFGEHEKLTDRRDIKSLFEVLRVLDSSACIIPGVGHDLKEGGEISPTALKKGIEDLGLEALLSQENVK